MSRRPHRSDIQLPLPVELTAAEAVIALSGLLAICQIRFPDRGQFVRAQRALFQTTSAGRPSIDDTESIALIRDAVNRGVDLNIACNRQARAELEILSRTVEEVELPQVESLVRRFKRKIQQM